MGILYVGIDLAKNLFAVHGVDATGKPALVRPALPRAKLHELIASLPPCVIGMEACSGAHHWARLLMPASQRAPDGVQVRGDVQALRSAGELPKTDRSRSGGWSHVQRAERHPLNL
jgi:transposase